MSLFAATDVSLAFGSRTLFERLAINLDEGERVGLVGVNGSGKSTLMKILAGVMKPDAGLLQVRRGARITYLPQEPEFPPGATVSSELAVANPALKAALDDHARLAEELGQRPDDQRLGNELSRISDDIERLGGWDTEHHAKMLLDRLGVHDWDRPVAELSGGLRKRVAIARALLSRPDLLLLDEPTNHLDADTVDWLEDELDQMPGGLLLVTHDRYFLDGLVDRISELGPSGVVTNYPGNYQTYLEQKLAALEEASVAQHKRDRWISQEVAWMRRGPEARRTKRKDRMERAQKLLTERGFQRPRVAELQTVAAPRLSQKVVEVEHLSKKFGERVVLRDVSVIIQGGEKVGLVGPNGVGKTTFLRVLLGELEADAGTRELGPKTRIAYYDQSRAQLDPEQTVYDSASNEDQVEVGGKLMALRDYLDDLLFPVPMQRMKVKALSGGERNRLLLAKLFLQGANLLVLDEPTNDLDLVTLNVLEGLIRTFSGSVLLVTHDRYFLDKVATSILAFEGHGKVVRYPGNYAMYRTLKDRGGAPKASANPGAPPAPQARSNPAKPKLAAPASKLGYMAQRELDGMESTIHAAEGAKAGVEAQLADPANFSDSRKLQELQRELERASAEVDRLYARWQQLEAGQS